MHCAQKFARDALCQRLQIALTLQALTPWALDRALLQGLGQHGNGSLAVQSVLRMLQQPRLASMVSSRIDSCQKLVVPSAKPGSCARRCR